MGNSFEQKELNVFAKEKLDYSAVQLPDRVEMNANDSVKAAEAHLEFMRKRHSVRDFVPTPVPSVSGKLSGALILYNFEEGVIG